MGIDHNAILRVAIKGEASDIHSKFGLPPIFRVDGALVPVEDGGRLMPGALQAIASAIMSKSHKEHVAENRVVESLLVVKMVEERRSLHSDGFGDVLEARRRKSVRRKQLFGRRKDSNSCALPLGRSFR